MSTPSNEHEQTQEIDDSTFFPRGAIAFFVVLILFFAVLWFSMYFDVLARQ